MRDLGLDDRSSELRHSAVAPSFALFLFPTMYITVYIEVLFFFNLVFCRLASNTVDG